MFKKISNKLRNLVSMQNVLDPSIITGAITEIKKVLYENDIADHVADSISSAMEQHITMMLVKKKSLIKKDILNLLVSEIYSRLNKNTRNDIMFEGLKKTKIRILLTGYHGSGKTSVVHKLSHIVKKFGKFKVSALSIDFSRNAAHEQLRNICKDNQVDYISIDKDYQSNIYAFYDLINKNESDVLIIDTKGLYQNEKEISTLQEIQKNVENCSTIFVADSNFSFDIIKKANEAFIMLKPDGIIMTKVDTIEKKGVFVNMMSSCDIPILYLSDGEKSHNIRGFDASYVTKMILQIEDKLHSVKKSHQYKPKYKANEKRMSMGKTNFNDIETHIKRILGIKNITKIILKKTSAEKTEFIQNIDHKSLNKQLSIIESMTPLEKRSFFDLNGQTQRLARIAHGSGNNFEYVEYFVNNIKKLNR